MAYADLLPKNDSDYVDIDVLNSRLNVLNRNKWFLNAQTKPKLETFLEVVNKDVQVVVRSNLSKRQRSLVTKIECGVLPLRVETGRFKNTPRELRLCQICTDLKVETEYHFLFECPRLEEERKVLESDFDHEEGFSDMTNATKLKTLLKATNAITFSKHLDTMFEARRKHMYTVEKESRRGTQGIQGTQLTQNTPQG